MGKVDEKEESHEVPPGLAAPMAAKFTPETSACALCAHLNYLRPMATETIYIYPCTQSIR